MEVGKDDGARLRVDCGARAVALPEKEAQPPRAPPATGALIATFAFCGVTDRPALWGRLRESRVDF